MTNKHGTVKLFTFSFEIDAPNIISCAPKTFSCVPKNLHLVAQDSAPKLKFKLWALMLHNVHLRPYIHVPLKYEKIVYFWFP